MHIIKNCFQNQIQTFQNQHLLVYPYVEEGHAGFQRLMFEKMANHPDAAAMMRESAAQNLKTADDGKKGSKSKRRVIEILVRRLREHLDCINANDIARGAAVKTKGRAPGGADVCSSRGTWRTYTA